MDINKVVSKNKTVNELALDEVQKSSIIPNESGILEKRGPGFHLSSEFARKHLPHIPWADEYICSTEYVVNRECLDSYVLFYIKSGKLKIRYENRSHTASTGDVVFLDLRKQHSYQALSELNIQQYMVNGGPTTAYFEFLFRFHGPVFTGNNRISFIFDSLYSELWSDNADDHILSLLLNELYCILAKNHNAEVSEPTRLAMNYMDTHYAEPITLDEIAEKVCLSKYYFLRRFHKETTYSPKEYLNRVRLRNAMHRLCSTADSVEQIALLCGFSSSTVFIRAFKKETDGITPERFRQYFSGTPMGLGHPG